MRCGLKTGFLPVAFAVFLLPLSFSGCRAMEPERFQAQTLGPFDTLTVMLGYTENEETFNQYSKILFDRLEALHRLYDIYNAYDGLDNMYTVNQNAGIAPVKVDQELVDMLLAAKKGYEITGGQTNPAMGSVLSIWHDHRMQGTDNPDAASLPSMQELEEANGITSMEDLVIDEANRTVFLRKPGMSLDVGAIAKGFAAGLSMDAAVEAGLQIALLSVGGHVIAVGEPPERDYWNIAIQNPESSMEGAPPTVDTVSLTNATVSISGAYQRFFVVDGKSYGHIIDPKTLMPADRYKQVAVIHPVSWMADALSTALFILPVEEGEVLAESIGAEVLWIDMEGNWFATPGYIRVSGVLKNEPAQKPKGIWEKVLDFFGRWF